jgi:CheY-like chemotaxis protein
MSRILLAEDDRISRVMLQAVLMKWGHEVVPVVDGRDALERLLDPDGPSLAILDWLMPELSGVEVCRTLRGTAGIRPIHIILLTAKAKGAEAAEALAAGADDHMSKPYDLVELQARIQLGFRRLESAEVAGSRLGLDQDLRLQSILSRFLPLNRMALETVLADPGQLGVLPVGEGSCDLAKVVPEIVSDASGFLSDRIQVSVAGASAQVAVCARTLRQIVLNLLVHLRMASPDRLCRVDIFWHDRADGKTLCFVDDGPGVLTEDVTSLGWPVTTLRNQDLNPGFGLFFANLAAESAGCTITCSAGAGRGLRTEIRIPAPR